MDKKCSIFCAIMSVVGYIMGVMYCFTLILIPLGVYCFIGAKRYNTWSSMTVGELASQKQSVLDWCIFFSLVAFPIGLLSLAPTLMSNNNNITITNVEEPSSSTFASKTANSSHDESTNASHDKSTNASMGDASSKENQSLRGTEETSTSSKDNSKKDNFKNEDNKTSDAETLEKLKKLLGEGLITEEEYKRAKSEVEKK